ncbi:hypothetical protein ACH5RR_008995 [Cinchona calisaya]|uniref:Uncharacterized protein n=1 Tax=Cinchona calisaya TaxID=153742 RepID=A0ABD3AEU4_9GENT
MKVYIDGSCNCDAYNICIGSWLDILPYRLNHVHPFNMASWLLEPDPPTWHFGPLDNELGPRSKDMDEEDLAIANDDGIGPSRLS